MTLDIYHSRWPIYESVMRVAWLWAQDRSKDPNTKVGAGVYHPSTGALFLGYNGFNFGVPDLRELWDCRDQKALENKYARTRHAEANAVTKAWQCLGGREVATCILMVTHFPCHRCMVDFIAPAGIRQVYYGTAYPDDMLTELCAEESNVSLHHMPLASVLSGLQPKDENEKPE